MTYVTVNLGIEIEHLHPLPGVIDLNIKPAFVQSCFTPSTIRDVTIVGEHIGDVYINGKQVTTIEPHEREDIAALEKLRTTLELDTALPHTIYTFAELRVRRLESELKRCREALQLAHNSLEEIPVDPEQFAFGPAYTGCLQRKREATTAVKKALKPKSIEDLISK